MLANEYGTASNIKSRVNRQSVLAAITSAQQRLKLYTRVRCAAACAWLNMLSPLWHHSSNQLHKISSRWFGCFALLAYASGFICIRQINQLRFGPLLTIHSGAAQRAGNLHRHSDD